MSAIAITSRKRSFSPTAVSANSSEMMPPPTLKRVKLSYSKQHDIDNKKNIYNNLKVNNASKFLSKTEKFKRQQHLMIKQAVVLRVAILQRAIRGDVAPHTKNYKIAISSARIPPISRGWRNRLSKSLNENRFDLILRLLAEAYVACSIDKSMSHDERLNFVRTLDSYYLQTLDISKMNIEPANLQDESIKLTKKISELAITVTNFILSLGLGRLINLNKRTRSLFLQLQDIVVKAKKMGRNSQFVDMGRSLLTLIFLDDRLEGQNLSSTRSSSSLKLMISMILDNHTLSELGANGNV
jgi:hypothetical protein